MLRTKENSTNIDIPASVPSDTSDEETFIRRRQSARKIHIPASVPSDTSDKEPLIRRSRHRAAINVAVGRRVSANVFLQSSDEEPLARRQSKRKITIDSDTSTLVPSETSDEEPSKRRRRSMRIRPSVDYRAHTQGFTEDAFDTLVPEESNDHAPSAGFVPSAAESVSHDSKAVRIPSDGSEDKEPFIRRRHRRDLGKYSTFADCPHRVALETSQIPVTGSGSGDDRPSTLYPTPNINDTRNGNVVPHSNQTTEANHIDEATYHASSAPKRRIGPQLLCNLPPQIFELIQLIPPKSTIRSHKPPHIHESVRQKAVEFCHRSLSSATRDKIAGLLTLMPKNILQSLAQTIEYIIRWCSDAAPGCYGLEDILEG